MVYRKDIHANPRIPVVFLTVEFTLTLTTLIQTQFFGGVLCKTDKKSSLELTSALQKVHRNQHPPRWCRSIFDVILYFCF